MITKITIIFTLSMPDYFVTGLVSELSGRVQSHLTCQGNKLYTALHPQVTISALFRAWKKSGYLYGYCLKFWSCEFFQRVKQIWVSLRGVTFKAQTQPTTAITAIMHLNTFVQVFCTSLNGNTFEIAYNMRVNLDQA